MDYLACEKLLSKRLTEKRFRHSQGVSQEAGELAGRFGAPPDKARLAGLLHDCAREFTAAQLLDEADKLGVELTEIERRTPVLLHAIVGAELVRSRYGVDDPQIARAIRLHTTGGADMRRLDKIIYLADMIEPGRDFPGIGALRKCARIDLDQAMLAAFNQSLSYVLEKNLLVHPDTIAARNEILLKG